MLYDAVVVGAEPAGLATARDIARVRGQPMASAGWVRFAVFSLRSLEFDLGSTSCYFWHT
jgi:NADPH-dependent 2,4-dienoyl-CoA reductase/sulfur reductase-like enzyme